MAKVDGPQGVTGDPQLVEDLAALPGEVDESVIELAEPGQCIVTADLEPASGAAAKACPASVGS